MTPEDNREWVMDDSGEMSTFAHKILKERKGSASFLFFVTLYQQNLTGLILHAFRSL